MKRLTLQKTPLQAGEVLDRHQLKQIVGGIAPLTCPITICPGYAPLPNNNYYCTNTTPDECQTAADAWCEGNDACCDVDCPGAGV